MTRENDPLPPGTDSELWAATRVRAAEDTSADVRAEIARLGYCLFTLSASLEELNAELRGIRQEQAMSTKPALPPWPPTPPAYGHVELHWVTDDHLGMARELATDPYVPTIGTLPQNASEADARAWVGRQHGRYENDEGFSFAVIAVPEKSAVGQCGLWLRDLADGRASAGYSIVPSARGHGYAAEALTALTEFAWTITGLHRVALYIEPWNIGSIRTAERAGYACEGTLRSYQEIADQRRDMLIYAAVR